MQKKIADLRALGNAIMYTLVNMSQRCILIQGLTFPPYIGFIEVFNRCK